MNRMLRLPASILRARAATTPRTAEQIDRPTAEQLSGPQAELARLAHRLKEIREAIRMLDSAPENRTAQALLDRYRDNEQRLAAEYRRVERELGELSSYGAVAVS